MDRDVIERKLESLRHCIARVRTKRPPAAELLAADADLATRLRRAVGFRNIAVHNYEAIDWEIVWLLAGDPLRDFEAFARQAALRLT